MTRRVWTFRLTGGFAFRGMVNIPNAFPVLIEHPGGKAMTVCSLRLSADEATQTETMLRAAGIHVTRWSVEETTEQRQLRDRLRAASEAVLPSVKCPGCFWLDLECPQLCGYVGWDSCTTHESLETHPRARADLASCPVYGAVHKT